MTDTLLRYDYEVPGEHLCGLTCLNGFVWFSDARLEQILALDPNTGKIIRRLSCPGVRTGLTNVDGRLWQVAGASRALCVINPINGRCEGQMPNPREQGELCGIETCGDSIWLGYRDPHLLDLRDRTSFALLQSIALEFPVAGVTAAPPYVAYAVFEKSKIYVLYPQTERPASILDVPGQPTGLGFDGSLFWYCDYRGHRVRALESPLHARPQ